MARRVVGYWRADGDRAGRAEDLKEFIDTSQFRELAQQRIFIDGEKPRVSSDRTAAEAVSCNDSSTWSRRLRAGWYRAPRRTSAGSGQRRSVPKSEPDSKGHQSTLSIYPLPRMVWISLRPPAVDFIPQIIYVDVDDVGECVEVLIPTWSEIIRVNTVRHDA